MCCLRRDLRIAHSWCKTKRYGIDQTLGCSSSATSLKPIHDCPARDGDARPRRGLAISPQAAVGLTGGELYRECVATGESDEAAADVLHCIKYLKYQCGLLELRKLSQFACWPPPVFTVEYLVVFKRWAEQHPKWLSRPAPDTLAAALTEGFPCR